MISVDEFIATARTWVRTPYHHQGRLKNVGCDCIGLIVGIGREYGYEIDHPDFIHYGRSPRGNFLLKHCGAVCGQPFQVLVPGSIMVFWMNEATKRAQHLGIVSSIAPNKIIHCWASIGYVAEHTIDTKWLDRWICSYALPFVNLKHRK